MNEETRKILLEEFESVINRKGVDNLADTPDFILAEHLIGCLERYVDTVKARDRWFGGSPWELKEKSCQQRKI